MTIIRARPEMADVLSEIAWEAKQSWGYSEDWMEAWRDQLTLTPDVIRSEEAWFAEIRSRAAGFYVLRCLPNATGSLEHLWVRPDSMRMGVGSRLLEHAVDRGKAAAISSLSVVADPNAEAFYLKYGARRIGTETGSVCGHRRELPILTLAISQV